MRIRNRMMESRCRRTSRGSRTTARCHRRRTRQGSRTTARRHCRRTIRGSRMMTRCHRHSMKQGSCMMTRHLHRRMRQGSRVIGRNHRMKPGKDKSSAQASCSHSSPLTAPGIAGSGLISFPCEEHSALQSVIGSWVTSKVTVKAYPNWVKYNENTSFEERGTDKRACFEDDSDIAFRWRESVRYA